MFIDREDAGRLLADRFKGRSLRNPVILAIPRGGVVTGAVLARELDAELDVILSRKLRAPYQRELAVGAIAEDGRVYLNTDTEEFLDDLKGYLSQECSHQLTEIARRQKVFRAARPRAEIAGRSVIVTDDGIATGSTMIATLQSIRPQNPYELIVAVPVGSPDSLEMVRRWCDEVVCLLAAEKFWAVGQFYQDFTQVEDEEAVPLLREFATTSRSREQEAGAH